MFFRPIHALAALAAATVPATAADVVTILGPAFDTPGVGQVVGSSGSLTSYVIDDAPATIVAGPSEFNVVYVYPDGATVSQGCSAVGPSSVDCKVYMSDKDSGSTFMSSLPSSLMSEVGDYVMTITATNTGVRPDTTVETITQSSSTASSTSTPPALTTASQTTTSKPTADSASASTSGAASETTSSGASAQLVMNQSWIGGLLAVVLAVF